MEFVPRFLCGETFGNRDKDFLFAIGQVVSCSFMPCKWLEEALHFVLRPLSPL
jgi:hypothetical protein